MTRLHPLRELTLARLREFYRHPEAVFWVYGFPILMAIALGIAFRNRPVEHVPVDVQQGPRAAEVRAALEKDPRFVVSVQPADAARQRLRTGRVALVVAPGDPPHVVFDPTRPEAALGRSQVEDALQRAAGRKDPIAVEDTIIDEPGARYIDFLIPGLLGLNLMGGGLWGVGFVIAEMRIRKLLKRLFASPMKRHHFLLAVIGGRMFFTLPEVVTLLLTGWLLFGVPIQGNLLAILILSYLGASAFSGLGLLIASRVRTIEAVSGLMNLVMLPMWILSGSFFSAERFPAATQPFIQALPLTQLNNTLRAVILEGASFWSQWPAVLILMAWGTISFLLALKLFRWR